MNGYFGQFQALQKEMYNISEGVATIFNINKRCRAEFSSRNLLHHTVGNSQRFPGRVSPGKS